MNKKEWSIIGWIYAFCISFNILLLDAYKIAYHNKGMIIINTNKYGEMIPEMIILIGVFVFVCVSLVWFLKRGFTE